MAISLFPLIERFCSARLIHSIPVGSIQGSSQIVILGVIGVESLDAIPKPDAHGGAARF